MGACASRVVEVDGQPAAQRSASARNSNPGRRGWTEARSRSLAGNLVQTHGADGCDLRLEDAYSHLDSQILGSGMSGQVVTMRHRVSGTVYAIKTLNLEQMGVDKLDMLRSEVDAMRRLDHPNIVKLYETFEEGHEIHMVMELCTGGVLIDRLEQSNRRFLAEPEVARLVAKLLSALVHCHERNVLHRDIKLENLMYESPSTTSEVKLIDFGLSHLGTPDTGVGSKMKAKGRVGTVSYMAPEVLRSKATHVPYAAPCDVWSLGVVAYMLLSGRRPFHAPKGDKEREQKIDLILHSEPSFEGGGWRHVSDEAKEFVRALLQKDPEKRISAREAMRHPWLVHAKEAAAESSIHGKHLSSPASVMKHHSGVVWEMQAFSSLSRVHKVALELVAFAATTAEVEQLRQLFYAIDADGSGAINRDEFRSAMAAHPEFSERMVTRLFDAIDFDRRGLVSYNEFLAATLGAAMGPLDEDKVRAVFDRLDTDGDMIVSRDDLLRSLGSAVSEQDIDDMFEQLGITTGKLFFTDLLRLMTEKDEATKAGVRRTRVESKSISSRPAATGRTPGLSEVGRSLSLSDVVLASEAEAAIASKQQLSARPTWISRGRSIADLSKFVRSESSAPPTSSARRSRKKASS
jgi:calcium-dependent protein kinase